MIAVKGHVTGRVQGVGFRYFTRDQAALVDVTGYVKNLADESVEFFIQGTAEQVHTLIAKLKNGPRFSRVDSCEYSEVEPNIAYTSFDITY